MVTLVVDHAARSGVTRPDPHGPDRHHHGHDHPPRVDAAPSPEPVAMPPVTVDGVPITRRAIAAEVQHCPAATPGEGWRAATRALVVRQLLLAEAARLGIAAVPRTDADGRVETDEDATIRALIEQEVRVPAADEATLRRWFDNNRRRFVTPPLHEVDHILIAARRDDAEAFAAARERTASLALDLAAAPERFADVARAVSDCPSAGVGGSLGQIGPGDTTPEFEAALAGLGEGRVSAPVETRYGIHLIRVVRRIDGRPLPFDMVRERIAAWLDEHVRRRAAAQYVALLAGRADIRGITLDAAASPLVQ